MGGSALTGVSPAPQGGVPLALRRLVAKREVLQRQLTHHIWVGLHLFLTLFRWSQVVLVRGRPQLMLMSPRLRLRLVFIIASSADIPWYWLCRRMLGRLVKTRMGCSLMGEVPRCPRKLWKRFWTQ